MPTQVPDHAQQSQRFSTRTPGPLIPLMKGKPQPSSLMLGFVPCFSLSLNGWQIHSTPKARISYRCTCDSHPSPESSVATRGKPQDKRTFPITNFRTTTVIHEPTQPLHIQTERPTDQLEPSDHQYLPTENHTTDRRRTHRTTVHDIYQTPDMNTEKHKKLPTTNAYLNYETDHTPLQPTLPYQPITDPTPIKPTTIRRTIIPYRRPNHRTIQNHRSHEARPDDRPPYGTITTALNRPNTAHHNVQHITA